MTDFCNSIIQEYYKMYKRLPIWFGESVKEAVHNGNRATCAFGRTRLFFGDMANDEAVQRKLSAYFGQGGTSGNLNRTLNSVYFQSDLEQRGLMLLLQTHDSITGQVPIDKLSLLNEFLTIMEQPCIIKGREFTVPVDAKVGFSWKAGMVPYNDDFKIEQAYAKEKIVKEKYRYVA